jgi:hypothetical protein
MRHVTESSLDRKLSEYEAHRASLSRHIMPTPPSLNSSAGAAAADDTRPQTKKLLPPVSFTSCPPSPKARLSSPFSSTENASPESVTSTPRQQDYLRGPQTPRQPIQLSSPPESVSHSENDCHSRTLHARSISTENTLRLEIH